MPANVEVMSTALMQSGAAAASCDTVVNASRSEPLQAASPGVVASRSFLTAGSTALEVLNALEKDFAVPTADAKFLATTFQNTGAGVTDGTKLIHALQCFGVEAFMWILNGSRHKGAVASVSTMHNYLGLWRGHCSDISGEVRAMADRWTEVLHTSAHKNKTGKYANSQLFQPHWVSVESGQAKVSEKIVEFVQKFFPTGNDQIKKYNNFLAWLLAHLNAECHALKLPPLPDGYLRSKFCEMKSTAKLLRRTHQQSLVARGDDGSYKDLHSFLSATIGIEGLLFVVEQLQNGKTGWSEQANVQTQLLFLLQVSGGLRFEAVGIIRIHLFHIKLCRVFGQYGRDALLYICNNGKANNNHHLLSVGAIAHRNPRMCLFTALGEAMLITFKDPKAGRGETNDFVTYIDLEKPDSFMEVELCTASNESNSGGEEQRKYDKFQRRYAELLDKFREFAEFKGWRSMGKLKKTHQWRLEAIRWMQAHLVPKTEIAYFLNKFGAGSDAQDDEMHKSYFEDICPGPVSVMAGFPQHSDLRCIVSPHIPDAHELSSTPSDDAPVHTARALHVPQDAILSYAAAGASIDMDVLVNALEPEVKRMQQALEDSVQGLNEKERQAQCAVTAEGVARTMSVVLKALLCTSAARPRDANGEILKDEKPLHLSKTSSVYRRPVFESSEYKKLCRFIHEREERELAGERPYNACCVVLRHRNCFTCDR